MLIVINVTVEVAVQHHVTLANINKLHLAHLPLSEFGHQALADLHEDFLNPLTSDELGLVAAACIALDVVT